MDEVAKSSGLGTRATLIKFCVKVFLDDMEDRGERALPRGWKEIVESLDNRTTASRAAAGVGSLAAVAEAKAAYHAKKKRGKKNGGGK